MKSIRANLLVLLLSSLLPVVLASYLLLYLLVSASLRKDFDANLTKKLESFALMAEWEDGEVDEDEEVYQDFGDDNDELLHFEFAEFPIPEYQPSPNAEYYQVTASNGVVFARSPSLQGRNLTAGDDTGIADTVFSDARPGRIARSAIVPKWDIDNPPDLPTTLTFQLAVAQSTEGLIATLAAIRNSMLLAAALAVFAAFAVICFVIRKGLRPLDEVASELQAIGRDDLSDRVDTDSKPEELVPVVERLNEMLGRLDAVFERERRFTSDVAHELRTPLAELRTLAEVSARRESISEPDRRSYEDTTEIAIRMERLIATLLELSRCSSGQVVKRLQKANLAQLVENTWKPFGAAADQKGLVVRLGLDESTVLDTDPLILGTILSNLFSNAVAYTPPGGKIELDWQERDGTVALSLTNTTIDLDPDDLPHVFERFWRKVGPDSGTDNHFGLGLSLVVALSDVLGVAVEGRIPTAKTRRKTMKKSRKAERVWGGVASMVALAISVLWVGEACAFESQCERVASIAQKSCDREAAADYWLAVAKAANLPAGEAQDEAYAEAREELAEAREECRDIYEARLDFCDALDEEFYCPIIDPADFDTPLANPYYPLVPGTIRVYESDTEDGMETIVVEVLAETREILGVECAIVHDVVYLDGVPIEDTLDYYTTDNLGNAWYFGENSVEYEDGFPVSTEGSWIAGEDGAKPGIVMPIDPEVGDIYRQEFLLSEAEDGAEILSLNETVTVPAGTFHNCIQTADFTPLEPDTLEYKFYAAGVGVVKEVDTESGEVVELVP